MPAEHPLEGAGEELTVKGLQRATQNLKTKIENVKRMKEKHVEEKITEYDALIEEARQKQILYNEANDTLEYYRGVDEAGLLDAEDKKNLEELEKQVRTIENDFETINTRIKSIYEQPEIGKRIVESAEKNERTLEAEKEFTKSVQELERKIDELAESIKQEALRVEKLKEEEQKAVQAIEEANKIVRRTIVDADVISKNNPSIFRMQDLYSSLESPQEFFEGLRRRRSKLGIFQGKEKAKIDLVLRHEKDFEAETIAREQYKEVSKIYREAQEVPELSERCRELFISAWETERAYTNIGGKPTGLARILAERLYKNFPKIKEKGSQTEITLPWQEIILNAIVRKAGSAGLIQYPKGF